MRPPEINTSNAASDWIDSVVESFFKSSHLANRDPIGTKALEIHQQKSSRFFSVAEVEASGRAALAVCKFDNNSDFIVEIDESVQSARAISKIMLLEECIHFFQFSCLIEKFGELAESGSVLDEELAENFRNTVQYDGAYLTELTAKAILNTLLDRFSQ